MNTKHLNLLIFVLLIGLLIYLFSALFSSVLFGLMVASTFRPLKYNFFMKKLKLSNNLSVMLGILLLILIAVPFIISIVNISNEVQEQAQKILKENKQIELKEITSMIVNQFSFLKPYITLDQVESTMKSFLPKLAEASSSKVGNLLSSIPSFVIGVFFFLVSFYFFSLDSEMFKDYIIEHQLLTRDDVHSWSTTFNHAFQSTIIASVATGLVQALIITIAAAVTGMDFLFTIFFITLFLTQIPVLGTTPVSLVLIAVLYFQGETAFMIMMIGAAIIAGASDNIIRALVLQHYDGLHPLWGLISSIGGLIAIGPLGVVLGPALALSLDIAIKNKKHHAFFNISTYKKS